MRKRGAIIFTIGLIVLLLIGFMLGKPYRKNIITTSSAGIVGTMHIDEYLDDGMTITWTVLNQTDELILFDENKIAQVSLNGNNLFYHTNISMLKARECVSLTIDLCDVDFSVPNTIKVQATTQNMSSVSSSTIITPQEAKEHIR